MNTRSFLTRTLPGVLILTSPAFSQYYSNDLTPPTASAAKLNGSRSGKRVGGGSNNHAYVVSGNALTAVDLHPPTGYYSSMATSTDGIEHCGYSGSNLGGIHAMKWSGTSNTSSVDLHPSGFNFSYCTSVDNGDQGGFAEQQSYAVTISHAMLWHGSSVATDLHPAIGYTFSRVMSIRNGEQVGYGSALAYPYGDYVTGVHSASKALKWNGTAASVVELHPAGWDASEALATNGVLQGGWAYRLSDGRVHAMVWSGTAASAMDLHPAGYSDSKITAIFGNKQVGEGWTGIPGAAGSVRHALAWSGTAQSVVDLNQYLPPGYTHAVATGTDDSGNIVGYAYNTYLPGLGVGGDSIAVVFAPGQAPASALSSITLSPNNVAPDAPFTATVTLGGPAAADTAVTFLSTNQTALATPAPVTMLSGQSTAVVPLTAAGSTLTTPTVLKLYATDGTVSKVASLTVTPVVRLNTLTVNPVEGGLSTSGTITLTIPAQAGGALVTLTSSNPALLQVPASATVPYGFTSASFTAASTAVTALTTVSVTASFNGTTVSANVTLSPAPVVTLSGLTATSVVGGQTLTGVITLNNWVRDAAGATVTLSTGDTAVVHLPASVLIPRGSSSVAFSASTSVVSGSKGVSLKATYNGSQVSTTVTISPIPPISILSAVYKPDTQMLKIDATTTGVNAILTYGSAGVPFGTMQFEAGLYQGSIVLPTAPATVTVWSSLGGEVTVPVTLSVSSGGGSTGGGGGGGGTGGGGGGGSTTTTYKLSIVTRGKGTVATNPAGTSFSPGTVVTLTATPNPGEPWLGWTGACTGTSRTCSLTMNSDKAVTANFK